MQRQFGERGAPRKSLAEVVGLQQTAVSERWQQSGNSRSGSDGREHSGTKGIGVGGKQARR